MMSSSSKTSLNASSTYLRIMASIVLLLFTSMALVIYYNTASCLNPTVFVGTILAAFLGVCIVLAWSRMLEYAIFKPIKEVRDHILLLSEGQLNDYKFHVPNKEIEEVVEAVRKLSEANQKTFEFAKEMGKGNFKVDYETQGSNDLLGNAMLEMRKNMLAVAEDEKKRNWANEGMAKFGDLLRNDTSDVQKFSYNILMNLIKYVNANQGAFYVLNEGEKGEQYLTLTACYAWGRKKHIEHDLKVGEGLIGQAVLEREYQLLTEVPQNFLQITSGLGEANPNCVIILPLLFNEEVFGIIEMASFKVFEPFEVEFLNKLCVSIASAISTVKVNMRTNKLLADSLKQSEELREKDAALRQQLEEVRATQEEMERKELQKKQMEWKTNAILEGCVECIIAFNQKGTIEFFNKAAEQIFSIPRIEAIGLPISGLLPIEISNFGNGCGAAYNDGTGKRELTSKTEMVVKDLKGEELSILCSISKAKIGDECFFTAFIQNITVDIF